VVASATRDGHKLIAVVLGENTSGGRSLRASNLLEHGFQTYDWKALFPAQSIDTMPLADDAAGPTSIRETVISWVCGTARRAMAKLTKKKVATTVPGGEASKAEKKIRKPEVKVPSGAMWQ
jgi:D-alanyl-D-alanine carboxypeptidase